MSNMVNGKDSKQHVPHDVALTILSKLPLKSLFRFSCATKSWSLLFENSLFMSMFRRNFLSNNHSYYNDISLLLHHITPFYYNEKFEYELCSLLGQRFENKDQLNWPIPISKNPIDFNLYGFANVKGILCFEDKVGYDGIRSIEEVGKIVFWNPTTGKFKITPPSPFASEPPGYYPQLRLHGFGYDQSTDDYKVIRHISFSVLTENDDEVGKHPPLWEIYSLKNNSWRKVFQDMPTQYHGSVGIQVYMDGACHWWGEGETPNEVHLVSFFLSNDVFKKTSIPSNMEGGIDTTRVMFRHLDVLNGSIAWISNYAEESTFHISILVEIGVNESWSKLFIVEPSSFVEHPIGVGKNCGIFFRKKDDELVWLNLTTQEIEELGVKGGSRCKTIVYRESFLQIEM